MWADANATTSILVRSVVSRRLQEEEQQLRTSSLPAIPNPFPELCSPASSPVLSPGSLPQGEPPTDNYVSPIVTVVSYWGIHKTTNSSFFICRAVCVGLIFLLHIIIWCGRIWMQNTVPVWGCFSLWKTGCETSADIDILLCLRLFVWLQPSILPFEEINQECIRM